MQTPTAPFLRGNLEGYSTLASIWVRGLEATEEKLDKWASGLAPEAFWWSPVEGANSIGGLTNHIGVTALRLAHVARGLEIPTELQITPADQLAPSSDTPEAVIARTKAALAQMKTWLKEVTPDELETVCEWKGRGNAPAMHLWHKVIEHSLEHTGQIITLRKLWNAQQ